MDAPDTQDKIKNGADKAGKTLLWMLKAYLNPFQKKKWAPFIFALAYCNLIHPFSAKLLFPTAEDYLKDRDIDPQIAKLLSDREVRIRSAGFGTLHSFFDVPFLPLQAYRRIAPVIRGRPYADCIKMPLAMPKWSFNLAVVRMYPESKTAKSMVSDFTSIPQDKITNIRTTKEKLYTIALFHEIRHGGRENGDLPSPFCEADADLQALRYACQIYGDFDMVKELIHMRAMGDFGEGHDTCLYLDDRLQGTGMLSVEYIQAANKLADGVVKRYIKTLGDKGDDVTVKLKACREALVSETELGKWPLAAKRIRMYIEAAEYFAPEYAEVMPARIANPNAGVPPPVSPSQP